jgi:hypothetical protein
MLNVSVQLIPVEDLTSVTLRRNLISAPYLYWAVSSQILVVTLQNTTFNTKINACLPHILLVPSS